MEIIVQLLDELDDLAAAVRLLAPNVVRALLLTLAAAVAVAVWWWFPGFVTATIALLLLAGAAIMGVRAAVTRPSRSASL
ncbi:MAG TPA: hypothetical protein VLT59_00015 [Steroidobacteraceae bacterium]|nr:hypothetical protein [Steroidobacteraceae bacterium]